MEPTQNTPEAETKTVPSAPKGASGTTMAIIVVVILALLGVGYFYMQSKEGGEGFSFGSLFGGNEESGEAVARVNGEDISRTAYNEALESMRTNLEAQGADLSNPELQAQISDQVVNSLVETELLRQAATAGGFAATDTDVQQEYATLTEQLGGAEALMSQMASVGLSEDALRSDIKEQLTVRAYLRANIEEATLAVSDEEITSYYDEVAAQSEEELPPLEDVRAQIEQQLQLQKEQTAIAALIASLRANAEIEVLL